MQDEMIVSEGLPKHHTAAQPHTADLLLSSAVCTLLIEKCKKEVPTGEICFLHAAPRSCRRGRTLRKEPITLQCNYKYNGVACYYLSCPEVHGYFMHVLRL